MAAHVCAHGAVLVIENTGEFMGVASLRVGHWLA
jgi:predicted nucleic acid-binding protein